MFAERSNDPALLRTMLDAIPLFVFVVDADSKILDYNRASAKLLGEDRPGILHNRLGNALDCLHAAASPDGCGYAGPCKTCAIRESVNQALAGVPCVRQRGKLELSEGGGITEISVLVTASSMTHASTPMAVLVIEDISQLAELHRIIPICIYCKKIRTDDQCWLEPEKYFSLSWGLKFTHGLCPECYAREMIKMNGTPTAPK